MVDTTRLSQNASRQLPWLWQILGKSWRPYALALSLIAATIAYAVYQNVRPRRPAQQPVSP